MFEALPFAIFGSLLIIAAISDVATMTIPNWISIALACAFPLAALMAGLSWQTIAINLGFSLAILAIGFLLFQGGFMGGGDAKLIAAAAAWTGPVAFAPFALATSLVGGVVALVLLGARKIARPAETRPAYLNRLLKPRGGVPFAVAIASGGIFVLNAGHIAAALTR
ncbi:MAG: prepilin peptidase [Hyphomonadaceae bacterium]